MKKVKLVLFWKIKILLAAGFTMASLGKLTKNENVINMFQDWGFFDGFYFIIGILELVGAILLLIPKTSLYAAIALFIIMIGAAVTHLVHDPIMNLLRPGIFMLLLFPVIYIQWNQKKVLAQDRNDKT